MALDMEKIEHLKVGAILLQIPFADIQSAAGLGGSFRHVGGQDGGGNRAYAAGDRGNGGGERLHTAKRCIAH